MRTSPAPYIPPLCAHAAGILLRTSCPNSRGKVCLQEWQSFSTTNFVDISHPRSSQQLRTGFKDRPVFINNTFGIFFLHNLWRVNPLALWISSSGYREGKNALLHAASQFCGLCRGSVAIWGAPVCFCSNREDLPLALRVFWGAAGLQSAKEGANSRVDPGMDDPTVSQARSVAYLRLLFWLNFKVDCCDRFPFPRK